MKHTDEECDYDEQCDSPGCEYCLRCCPEHLPNCSYCNCYPDDPIELCDEDGACLCHNGALSDKEERDAERRQMGITDV